jgi:hypothetical protein
MKIDFVFKESRTASDILFNNFFLVEIECHSLSSKLSIGYSENDTKSFKTKLQFIIMKIEFLA